MKKTLIPLVLSVLPFVISGQAPFPSGDEIKQFILSKTCVVLANGNPVYNTYISRGIKEYWTITPFEIIDQSEFEARRADAAYSFIILTETSFEKDKSGTRYNYINLLQGKDVAELGGMPEICAVPLSVAEADDMEYGKMMGPVLLFMQNHAKKISEDPALTGRRYLRYYNRNTPEVKSRKILVRQEDLAPSIDDQSRLRTSYKYTIEIVGEEEIVKAIREKRPNTLILHKVSPEGSSGGGICFKMLFGTDDQEMYYYNEHNIDRLNPGGLLPADLKRLERF